LADSLVTLSTPAAAINDRLLKLENKVAKDKAAKEAIEKRLETAKSKHRDVLDESVIYATLSKAKDLEARSRLRQEIRRKVSRIDIHFGKKATMFMGADALAKGYFANGAERWIVFDAITVREFGVAVQVFIPDDEASSPP
jgi:hypothetical protein